jgi:excisionase family DNA binding protein
MSDPLLLTVRETADLLRTTPKAIYALIERGHLAGVVRLGRRVLVNREALLRSIERATVQSTKKASDRAAE